MHIFGNFGIKAKFIIYIIVLYCFSDNGQPKEVVKTVWPMFNTLVFFEVMCKSFHQVSILIYVNTHTHIISVLISETNTDFMVRIQRAMIFHV